MLDLISAFKSFAKRLSSYLSYDGIFSQMEEIMLSMFTVLRDTSPKNDVEFAKADLRIETLTLLDEFVNSCSICVINYSLACLIA